MTAGTNGEPDDPYGFLYRPAPGEEPAEAAGTTGAYGPSANRMMPQYVQVGQMNYGPPPAQTQAQPLIPAQPDHGGTQPPREPGRPRRSGGGAGGSGRGPVIGAIIAIVIVAGVIAGVLVSGGDKGDKKANEVPTTTAPTQEVTESAPPTVASSTAPDGRFGVLEAEDATLTGGAVKVAGVANSTGTGMTDMSAPGSTITWSVNAPKEGSYYFAVRFMHTASDRSEQNLGIRVNGADTKNKVKLKSYSASPSVSGTWNLVTLQEGSSEISLICAPGMTCKASLDQVWFSDKKPEFG